MTSNVDSVQEPEQIPARILYGIPAKNPSDVAKDKGCVCGIMGLPYTGKTSLLPTLLPKYGPVGVIDVGGGTYVLKNEPGVIQVWEPQDWFQLNGMLDALEEDPAPFKTIWLDAVSYMQQQNIDFHDIHSKTVNDKRGRQILYGESNWDVVQKIHSRLINLSKTHGTHIFFVYWMTRPVQQEGGENPSLTQRHIYLSPTVGVMVNGILDLLIAVSKTPGSEPYPPILTLDHDQSIETKIRLAPDNPLKKWPGNVKANPTILTDLIDAFKGEVNPLYVK